MARQISLDFPEGTDGMELDEKAVGIYAFSLSGYTHDAIAAHFDCSVPFVDEIVNRYKAAGITLIERPDRTDFEAVDEKRMDP